MCQKNISFIRKNSSFSFQWYVYQKNQRRLSFKKLLHHKNYLLSVHIQTLLILDMRSLKFNSYY